MSSSTTYSNAEILATVEAPAGLGWMSFGFGQQMRGSLMFVLWLNNEQVVVSSRLGTYQPLFQYLGVVCGVNVVQGPSRTEFIFRS